jgi:hypothetical protein
VNLKENFRLMRIFCSLLEYQITEINSFSELIRQALDPSAILEILFEYVRRTCFPDKPSRFISFFAWQTLEQAQAFRRTHADETKPIWEIEVETYHRADMNLLRLEGSILQLS